MPNYAKVVLMLNKEFPDITSDEIDDMISKIPPNMPTFAIKSMIKLTKLLVDNPAKAKLLKETPASKIISDQLSPDQLALEIISDQFSPDQSSVDESVQPRL